MLGGDRRGIAKAKTPGFHQPLVALLALALVGRQHDRLARLAQQLREPLVDRGHASARVIEEDGDIGFADRDFRLLAHARFERLVSDVLESRSVDQDHVEVAEAPRGFLAVPCNARLVVDDCDLPASKPVEQGRLADIRATDDGHLQRHGNTPGAGPGLPT